ncbi:hypothetical protein PsYK624_147570 [Phanerochaete sordida]|uniref:Heterokaryon incompatibility domain-containing protein n=1 Tax=Phanerochaete sordida TaxID=48140 RepID=A0A9P3GN68_9APHY|nr:hypothetical protein PsYK624_147570 [Phanerochaete sordida]
MTRSILFDHNNTNSWTSSARRLTNTVLPSMRSFVLEKSPIQVSGYDIPWEERCSTVPSGQHGQKPKNIQTEPICVSRDKLMDTLFDRPCLPWDIDRRMEELRERRRDVWAMVQILAHSGTSPEAIIFRTPGHGMSFTLRPPVRSSIPLQWVHSGPYAIPDTLANLSCADMTLTDLLSRLNDVLGTKHALETDGILDLLDELRTTSSDFGGAYGKVRNWWTSSQLGIQGRKLYASLHEREAKHEGWRQDTIHAFSLRRSDIPPRRVWDLFSNRVLPLSVMSAAEDVLYELPDRLWTVSHSWVPAEERDDIWTPINGKRWPVPVPRGTTLEEVRIELLNMGAEYVWLDVLCLRQQGRDEDEALRTEEWKTDVPTIGHIYQGYPLGRPCITYFNGLGLPLDTSPDKLRSGRHWLNRVWTLQESLQSWLPGGLTGERLFNGEAFFSRMTAVPELTTSHRLSQELIRRNCTNELDKVAGLAYCLKCGTLPLYEEAIPVEEAWDVLLKHTPEVWRLGLLLDYPSHLPFALYPSWQQYTSGDSALRQPLPATARGLQLVDRSQLCGGASSSVHYSLVDEVYGSCRISLSNVRRSDPKARRKTQIELTLRFGTKGSSHHSLTLRPSRVHGVIQQGVPYMLVCIPGDKKACFIIVEVVHDRQAKDFMLRTVEAVKWAVIQVPRSTLNDLQKIESMTTKVIFVPGEGALRRTAYRDNYIAAFHRMRANRRTFIIYSPDTEHTDSIPMLTLFTALNTRLRGFMM